jgi:hypothetical protein
VQLHEAPSLTFGWKPRLAGEKLRSDATFPRRQSRRGSPVGNRLGQGLAQRGWRAPRLNLDSSAEVALIGEAEIGSEPRQFLLA